MRALFRWGAPLLKRHWSLRWGECPHCGKAEFRPSYDASKMAVLFGFPVLPLGKVHVHEHCQACEQSSPRPLDTWETEREEQLVPTIESLSEQPHDPTAATQALEKIVALGDPEDFLPLAQQIERNFAQDPDILSLLAWCHGHFAQFDEAQRLYAQAATLDDRPDRHAILAAYKDLPQTKPPKRPSSFLQGLRFLLLPILLIAGLTLYLAQAVQKQVKEVHVVNGLDRAYQVTINDQLISLKPFENQQITLKPGLVHVAPASEAFEFTPYQFDLKASIGGRPTTAVINPDKLAVITWEQVVYQNTASDESKTFDDDQFVLHAGEGFYLFDGITDHFQDPPEALGLHSTDETTYRFVIDHTGGFSPISVCTLLLGRDEMDLAEEYARNQLKLDPEQTGLLPFLRELSPTNETLAFIEPFLGDRPLRLDWHRHYVELAIALGSRASITERYAQFARAEPENGALRFLLGQSKEDSETALEDYLVAAKHGSPEAYYQLSLRNSALGDFTTALTHVEEALQVRPDHAGFQAQEEDLLLATAQYDELISRHRLRLEKDPLDQETATTLAGLYEVTGETKKAQSVTDRFIQTVALDGSLLSEETAQFREILDGVRAQWAGDSARYIKAHQGFDPSAEVNVLILKESIHEAASAIDRGSRDPFVHFFLYALASRQEDHLALAEVQLSQALTLLADDPIITPWFQKGAPSPTLIETLQARLPNHYRRVLLFALAQQHPESAETYLTLAKQLNYNRVFPYLALTQALTDRSENELGK